MLRRFILFLIRRRLGLKKCERFRFANQRSKLDYYFFTEDAVKKANHGPRGFEYINSQVSLNHLLSDDIEIVKI